MFELVLATKIRRWSYV